MAIGKVQTACEFPLYPWSTHGLSKNTLIFQTFGTAQTYTSYTSKCIVFDLNYFFDLYFLQVGLQRFSKNCPALNICA